MGPYQARVLKARWSIRWYITRYDTPLIYGRSSRDNDDWPTDGMRYAFFFRKIRIPWWCCRTCITQRSLGRLDRSKYVENKNGNCQVDGGEENLNRKSKHHSHRTVQVHSPYRMLLVNSHWSKAASQIHSSWENPPWPAPRPPRPPRFRGTQGNGWPAHSQGRHRFCFSSSRNIPGMTWRWVWWALMGHQATLYHNIKCKYVYVNIYIYIYIYKFVF